MKVIYSKINKTGYYKIFNNQLYASGRSIRIAKIKHKHMINMLKELRI